MKSSYQYLKLVDVVPGQHYVLMTPQNDTPIQLITFVCSEQPGAIRGYARLFSNGREIFPNVVNKWQPTRLTVIAHNNENKVCVFSVACTHKTDELVINSRMLWDNSISGELRDYFDLKIKDLQHKIEKLNEATRMLDKT